MPCARGPYGLPNGHGLVATEIVHDDDIARFEDGYELLLDICPEALPVDRVIENARCGQPAATKGTQERQSSPTTMWRTGPQASPLKPHPRNGAMLILMG